MTGCSVTTAPSFGEHVKILAPSLLVKKVCDAAAKVLGHYQHVG